MYLYKAIVIHLALLYTGMRAVSQYSRKDIDMLAKYKGEQLSSFHSLEIKGTCSNNIGEAKIEGGQIEVFKDIEWS